MVDDTDAEKPETSEYASTRSTSRWIAQMLKRSQTLLYGITRPFVMVFSSNVLRLWDTIKKVHGRIHDISHVSEDH